MKTAHVVVHNLFLVVLTGLVTGGAGWLIFIIGTAIPSSVHVFSDIALNAFTDILLILMIGTVMVLFSLLIAGLGYYSVRQICSHWLTVNPE